jgi:hypothetical protein
MYNTRMKRKARLMILIAGALLLASCSNGGGSGKTCDGGVCHVGTALVRR